MNPYTISAYLAAFVGTKKFLRFTQEESLACLKKLIGKKTHPKLEFEGVMTSGGYDEDMY